MGDPREPPEGAPEGGSGNDDEYRSVVFDESFVRAARIQELSARERLAGAYGRATRPKVRLGPLGTVPRQALALLLVILLAFAAAVYFGVSSPTRPTARPEGSQLTVSLVALSPASAVRAVADPASPFAGLPPGYSDGAIGLGTPAGSATGHFSRVEVTKALDTVQRYLVASSLAPATLVQGATSDVRAFVTPGEQAQFDASVAQPTDDRHHALTGWLVRFDPAQVALAADTVKVAGAMRIDEADTGTLQITTDHTFVYALKAAGAPSGAPVTLETVRRQLTFEFDRTDLASARLRLVDSVLQAGPAPCDGSLAGFVQPVLAGADGASPAAGSAASPPTAPPAVDPGNHARPAWQVCGVLAGS
ncbi:SCO2583 family membrane protein [Kitasatospora sp. NBC_00458]|uniref:SCO2583 family membrane protein n=1 Tax=Kitasatospora sp. NBC_00458 TaxID=2903568 RepID=UPI002E17B5CC